jgi:23S rRNA (guanosine2251-2'-O)-methyltransferase
MFCLAIGGALRGLNANITSYSRQNIMIEYGRDFRNALDTPAACAVFGFEILRQHKK